MEHFTMYVPVAKGKLHIDKIEIFAELIPKGEENAIKRDDLIDKCIEHGLIKPDAKRENQDRAMRRMIQKAKMDYNISITNNGKGSGYYRPLRKDQRNLDRNNDREDKKAISIFKGNKPNKAIAEDYRVGRLNE